MEELKARYPPKNKNKNEKMVPNNARTARYCRQKLPFKVTLLWRWKCESALQASFRGFDTVEPLRRATKKKNTKKIPRKNPLCLKWELHVYI